MKDSYIKFVDDKIEELKRSYWESKPGETETILFDLFREMDSKIIYIAKYPQRAKIHYTQNNDIAMIKEFRRRLGFNQGNLADFLGVCRETVNRWESGSIILSDDRRKQFSDLLSIHSQNTTK